MKKQIYKLLLLSIVFTLLVGCAPSAPKESQEETIKDNEISFMIPDWGAPTPEMLDDFKEKTGITVQVLPTSWDDIRDKISVAAAGNTIAADVFEVDWSWVGEFQGADWLLPIELSEEDQKDIPTVGTFTINDTIYAIPYANDFRTAYYNKDIYSKAGITEAPKTWEDVVNNAKNIKAQGISEYPLSLPLNADESATTTLFWLAYTRNGIVFNDDNSIHKDSILDALTLIDRMNRDGLINPANRNASGMDAYRQLTSGDASFLVGPSSFVSRVNNPEESQVIDQVEPILLPGKESQSTATVPFPEAIGISKNTKNPEAAKEFVKWYTSKETQKKLNEELNTIPTRNSVLNELIESGVIKNSGAMVELAKMVESPFPNGVPKYYTKMSTEIFNVINQMANESLTPEEAANKIEENVAKVVEENK
ncbi:MAG: sugar ABC transporter substrate-binding protein [Tissierellia bacterium]|nr:sugar ABC transporter substrate-binding protein [Tissierellia bacterium]